MEVAAGEYGWDPWYFRRMLSAQAVDVLQADASRCGGVTGFLAAGVLADAWQVPLSARCMRRSDARCRGWRISSTSTITRALSACSSTAFSN